MLKDLDLNILILLLNDVYQIKGNNCCFTDHIKKKPFILQCFCLWTNLVQTFYNDRYYWTLHFDCSLSDNDSRSQVCKKAKSSVSAHKVLSWFGWHVVHCWDFMVWWTLHWLSSDPIYILGREPFWCDLDRHTSVSLHLDICRLVSLQLGVMIDTAEFDILDDTGLQGDSLMRNEKLLLSFSHKFCGWFWSNAGCFRIFFF